MYHKRRKIIPVAQKSALRLSDIPMTQQGRRKMPCHEKTGDSSWFDRGAVAAARSIVSAPARINAAAGVIPC